MPYINTSCATSSHNMFVMGFSTSCDKQYLNYARSFWGHSEAYLCWTQQEFQSYPSPWEVISEYLSQIPHDYAAFRDRVLLVAMTGALYGGVHGYITLVTAGIKEVGPSLMWEVLTAIEWMDASPLWQSLPLSILVGVGCAQRAIEIGMPHLVPLGFIVGAAYLQAGIMATRQGLEQAECAALFSDKQCHHLASGVEALDDAYHHAMASTAEQLEYYHTQAIQWHIPGLWHKKYDVYMPYTDQERDFYFGSEAVKQRPYVALEQACLHAQAPGNGTFSDLAHAICAQADGQPSTSLQHVLYTHYMRDCCQELIQAQAGADTSLESLTEASVIG